MSLLLPPPPPEADADAEPDVPPFPALVPAGVDCDAVSWVGDGAGVVVVGGGRAAKTKELEAASRTAVSASLILKYNAYKL